MVTINHFYSFPFQRHKELNLAAVRNQREEIVGQATYESLKALPTALKKRLYNLFEIDFKAFGFHSSLTENL